MHRFFVYAAFAAALAAFPIAHNAFAGNKTYVCHVSNANSPGSLEYTYDYDEWYYGEHYASSGHYAITYHVGRLQEVGSSQLSSHLGHGDSTTYAALLDATEDMLTSLEATYADASQSYSWDYRPDEDYYGSYTIDYSNTTDAVIGNANCYWTTVQY